MLFEQDFKSLIFKTEIPQGHLERPWSIRTCTIITSILFKQFFNRCKSHVTQNKIMRCLSDKAEPMSLCNDKGHSCKENVELSFIK
jgi:hypothetical protein